MKVFRLLLAAFVVLALTGIAQAAPRSAGVVPYLEGNVVVIPPLPQGQILEVVVYNDAQEMPPVALGAQPRFELASGAGFNFQWQDAAGKTWWQLVAPESQAGQGLAIDCSHPAGCKYLRPM